MVAVLTAAAAGTYQSCAERYMTRDAVMVAAFTVRYAARQSASQAVSVTSRREKPREYTYPSATISDCHIVGLEHRN